MERHIVICRAESGPRSDPQSFVSMNHVHSEDGWTWAPLDKMPFLLEAHVAALVERIKGVEPADLANITISTRSRAEVEAEPPVTVQLYGPFLDYAPNTSIEVLAPIRIEPPRDKFEMWSLCSRHAGGGAGASGRVNFRVSTLIDALLQFFNDGGNPRQAWTGPEYRKWAANPRANEIWVRPGWELSDIAFLRNAEQIFPPPKPLPMIDPRDIAHKAAIDDLARRKAAADRVMASRGYTRGKSGAWTPPKGAA